MSASLDRVINSQSGVVTMCGNLVRTLDRKRYDFSFLAPFASQSVVLSPCIEAIDYCVVAIYARVHERSMLGSGQTLALSLYNTLPSDEDAREFIETDVTGSPQSFLDLTLTASLPPGIPGIHYSGTASPGPFLKLGLKATQGTATTTFYMMRCPTVANLDLEGDGEFSGAQTALRMDPGHRPLEDLSGRRVLDVILITMRGLKNGI